MGYNLKLWLLESFIRINDWEKAEEIYGGFYDYKLDLTLNRGLLYALFDVMHWFIDPLYCKLSKSNHIHHKVN